MHSHILFFTCRYNSVASLLLGELLPANLRSIGVGLIATTEVLSSLSQTGTRIVMEPLIGRAGLFFVFAGVVTAVAAFAFG